jgi:O-antigen ligase
MTTGAPAMALEREARAVGPAASDTAASVWNRVAFGAFVLWLIGAQTFEALATAGLVLTIVCALVRWRRDLTGAGAARFVRAWWPLLAFIGWALFVPLLAGHPPEGAGVGRLSDWLALPAVVAVFPWMTQRQRAQLGGITAAVFALSCLAAFLQHRGWWPPEGTFDALAWTKTAFSRVYEPIVTSPGRFYGGGLAFHRLRFADAGGIVIVAAFALAIRSSGRVRIAAVAAIGLGLAALLIAAQARAAFGAVAATLVLMVFLAPVRARDAALGLAALALVSGGVVAASPGVRRRFALSLDRDSNGERQWIWHIAARAVRESPLTGMGLGQYRASKVLPVEPGTPPALLDHPGKGHNQFLSFAAEIGIPGALLFAWMLAWLFFTFHGAGRLLGRGVMTFFVLLSCFHDPLYHANISMFFVLVFGIALALEQAPNGR